MQAKPLRGIHVLWMLIAFFTVIIGADVFFIVRAVSTFPGEQVRNSYVLGLDYNREVESRERQAELGWSAEAGIRDEGGATLIVRLADRASAPVTDLHVVASYFPAGSGNVERQLKLIERSPGEYAATMEAVAGSRVAFSIAASRTDAADPVFRASKTMVVS